LTSRNDVVGALRSFKASYEIALQLARTEADAIEWKRDVLALSERIGTTLDLLAHPREGLVFLSTGLALAAQLARRDPENPEWRRNVAVFQRRIGEAQSGEGRYLEATSSFRTSRAIFEELARTDPQDLDLQHELAASDRGLGVALSGQGNIRDALMSFQSGLAIFERLALTDTANVGWQLGLVDFCMKIAEISRNEAPKLLTRALAIVLRLRDEGRLTPAGASMPDEIAGRLAALQD
jgi:tetratricopeptide (TPR) repeat protein